jgi:hypothetical protein
MSVGTTQIPNGRACSERHAVIKGKGLSFWARFFRCRYFRKEIFWNPVKKRYET